jgi:dihydrofolate synthase / folylpolyglutamate synthase
MILSFSITTLCPKIPMNTNIESNENIQAEYESAHDFLYGFIDYERGSDWKYNDEHFNLGRVYSLLESIGNPHKKGRFIHITGTNGKGSVASLVASSLSKSGYKTGLYTSPHLLTFRERIQIDGRMISKSEVVHEVNKIKSATEHIEGLTFFDVWTVLALNYFAGSATDISVIEVGLGGRLDSTNVIVPDVSVFTSISMDHRGKLGDTVEKIALEKSGIIKPGVPVVSSPQTDGVMKVLREKAQTCGSDFMESGTDTALTLGDSSIHYSGISWEMDGITIPFEGDFQRENTSVALGILEKLSVKLTKITPENAVSGIADVSWPGRLQTLATDPRIIIDGASNIGAMTVVSEYLRKSRPSGNIVALFGICGDKDTEMLVGILRTAVSHFVFTRADNPRSLFADELMRLYGDDKTDIYEADSIAALKKAASLAGPNGIVIVTGSLYLVGEIYKLYKSE